MDTFPTVETYLDASGAAAASLVLLCQSTHPGITAGVHDLDRLTPSMPQRSAVVLPDGEDLQQIRAAIDSGARGYIPMNLKLARGGWACLRIERRIGGVFSIPQCADK